MIYSQFSTLSLHPDLLKNLDSLGYKAMTPIQEQSLPHIIQGGDVIGQSQTGSGKTAAFGLGLLNKLEVKKFRIQSLVLCPTRELADQVAKELRKLARSIHNIKILTLCGGMPFGPQIGSLEHGAHIIVGTPGRVEEHLRKGTLKLHHLNTFVLDEADRMLEMGFQDAIDAIIEQMPAKRQTLLFSATYPDKIESIAKRIMHKPLMVKVASSHNSDSIEEHFYKLEGGCSRQTALQLLLQQFQPESSIVFCNTKRETQEVADALKQSGFAALALHGDLEQRDRDRTLIRFANKSASILVATDVAARGLDIDNLDAVFNYHITRDPEVHVHRVAQLDLDFDPITESEALPPMTLLEKPFPRPEMTTLQIDGGKKQKVRPGDILGALTGAQGIEGKQVGKINVGDNWAYVAVTRGAVKTALKKLGEGKMKGRNFRVRTIR